MRQVGTRGRTLWRPMHRIWIAIAILCLGFAGAGCQSPTLIDRLRGDVPKPVVLTPLPPTAIIVSSFERDLEKTSFEAADQQSLVRLLQLAEIFYQQLAHRRLNSIATFHDPALREFFRSEEAFADYYADLVQDLGDEHFEANRPQLIDLKSFHVEDAVDRAVAVVNFQGDNSLPLRFWSVNYSRRDIWVRIDDRWWIVPGKL